MESAASEWWRFVVGGEPGLALSLFFGDEFGSLAPFLVDAVATVLLAGLFAARHYHIAIGAGLVNSHQPRELAGRLRHCRKQRAAAEAPWR